MHVSYACIYACVSFMFLSFINCTHYTCHDLPYEYMSVHMWVCSYVSVCVSVCMCVSECPCVRLCVSVCA